MLYSASFSKGIEAYTPRTIFFGDDGIGEVSIAGEPDYRWCVSPGTYANFFYGIDWDALSAFIEQEENPLSFNELAQAIDTNEAINSTGHGDTILECFLEIDKDDFCLTSILRDTIMHEATRASACINVIRNFVGLYERGYSKTPITAAAFESACAMSLGIPSLRRSAATIAQEFCFSILWNIAKVYVEDIGNALMMPNGTVSPTAIEFYDSAFESYKSELYDEDLNLVDANTWSFSEWAEDSWSLEKPCELLRGFLHSIISSGEWMEWHTLNFPTSDPSVYASTVKLLEEYAESGFLDQEKGEALFNSIAKRPWLWEQYANSKSDIAIFTNSPAELIVLSTIAALETKSKIKTCELCGKLYIPSTNNSKTCGRTDLHTGMKCRKGQKKSSYSSSMYDNQSDDEQNRAKVLARCRQTIKKRMEKLDKKEEAKWDTNDKVRREFDTYLLSYLDTYSENTRILISDNRNENVELYAFNDWASNLTRKLDREEIDTLREDGVLDRVSALKAKTLNTKRCNMRPPSFHIQNLDLLNDQGRETRAKKERRQGRYYR